MKRVLVLALFVAGCPMKSTSSGGSTMPSPNNGGGGTPTGGGGGAGDGWVIAPDVMGRSLDEARALAKSAGMTSEVEEGPIACEDEAKKYLSQFDFDGNIVVGTLQQHIADCERDHICSSDGGSGIGIHDDLRVYFNLMYDPPSE